MLFRSNTVKTYTLARLSSTACCLAALAALPALVSCSRPEAAAQATVQPVDIRGISYDWDHGDLTVRFAGGFNYQYHKVAPRTFEQFKGAKHPREFFEQRFRGRAPFAGHEHFQALDTPSRDVDELAYHPASQILLVRFNPKSIVEYRNVPESAVAELLAAPSVRDHLSEVFRGRYPAHRL